jgi:hypothetical protein
MLFYRLSTVDYLNIPFHSLSPQLSLCCSFLPKDSVLVLLRGLVIRLYLTFISPYLYPSHHLAVLGPQSQTRSP